MSDCVFCKIVAEEIPSIKIWENDQCIAILDAFPACKAQVVVLPKNHCSSDIFILDDILYTQLMLASKEVVALLKKWLCIERIGLVVEWLQVPHAHVKLYPFRWGKSFVWWFTGHTLVDTHELQQLADWLISL